MVLIIKGGKIMFKSDQEVNLVMDYLAILIQTLGV